MAPSAIDPPTQTSELSSALPPPKLYYPEEAHFGRFIKPKADGYHKAKSLGHDKATIVIDNGKNLLRQLSSHILTDIQVLQLPEQDGPSKELLA
jgi:hypothetical protein